MDGLKRIACLLLASTIGLAGAVGYAWLTWPPTPPGAPVISKSEAEFIENERIFEVCVIFFALIYYSGRGFARLFNAPALVEEIKRRGDWHLSFLMAMLGVTTATRIWFTSKHGWHQFDDLAAIVLLSVMMALAIMFKLKIGLRKAS